MKEGDVVLTPIPQVDGAVKNRPAIILREMPPYRDFLVSGVSTQLDKEVKGFDEVISSIDDDFNSSGPRTTSLVSWDFWLFFRSVRFSAQLAPYLRHATAICSRL